MLLPIGGWWSYKMAAVKAVLFWFTARGLLPLLVMLVVLPVVLFLQSLLKK
jgi:hypothetical protein